MKRAPVQKPANDDPEALRLAFQPGRAIDAVAQVAEQKVRRAANDNDLLAMVKPVEEALEEAARTARYLPSTRLRAAIVVWPDVVRTFAESYGMQAPAMPRITPTSGQITQMDRMIALLWALSVRERKIVWGKASGLSYRKLAKGFQCSHETIRLDHQVALLKIALALLKDR